MPQITSIEPQKRKTGRFNVYLDGSFAFGLSDIAVHENSLKVGKSLNQEAIDFILKKEELAKLTDLSLNFLSYRPRSEKEVKDYLALKIAKKENVKFHEASQSPLIDKVLTKLKKYKYLDDLAFTKWYLSSRKTRPKSLRLLKLELRQKGIDKDLIGSIPQNQKSEIQLAKIALEKRINRWKNLSHLEKKKKVYQYLATRGFDFETIREVFAFFNKTG